MIYIIACIRNFTRYDKQFWVAHLVQTLECFPKS